MIKTLVSVLVQDGCYDVWASAIVYLKGVMHPSKTHQYIADVAAVPKPGLHNLASPGFYKVGLKEDVNVELKNICEGE